MGLTKLKKGDVVEIYQKWMTNEEPEGKAELIEKIGDEPGYLATVERWRVRFLEDEAGITYPRTIFPTQCRIDGCENPACDKIVMMEIPDGDWKIDVCKEHYDARQVAIEKANKKKGK